MKNPFDLSGRRALVTGGGSGLGLAIAHGLASAGASVVINGRNRDKLDRAADQLRRDGETLGVAAFDVTDPAAVAAAVATLEREGSIDILVNNAAINQRGPLDEFTDADWRRLMAANLDAPFFVTRAVVPAMKARRHGKIINLCSLASDIGRPNIVPYAASKGGVRMLTRALAVELAPVRVNAVCPGLIRTGIWDSIPDDKREAQLAEMTRRQLLPRPGEPSETAEAYLYLMRGSYTTGQVLYVEGGRALS